MVSHCQDHSCFSATTVLPLALGCHPTRNGVVMALSTQDFCPFIKEEWTKKRTRKVHVIQTVIFPFSGSWTVYSRNVWICLLIFSRPEGYLFSVHTNGSPDPYYIPSGLPPFGSLLCCWCPPLKGPTPAHSTHCHSQLPRMEQHWEGAPEGASPASCNHFPLQMFLPTLQSCPSVFPTKSFTPWALKARGAGELPAPSPWETQSIISNVVSFGKDSLNPKQSTVSQIWKADCVWFGDSVYLHGGSGAAYRNYSLTAEWALNIFF